MKWIVILSLIIMGTLTLAFMTPTDASGDLLSFSAIGKAFSGGSFFEVLKEKTPGRVMTVTGNTAARLAGKTLSATTGALGPIIDSSQREKTLEEAQESATSFIPKTNEQKREALVAQLEARVAELEAEESAEMKALKEELDALTQELKKVQEDGGFFDTILSGAKNVVSDEPPEECQCSVSQ